MLELLRRDLHGATAVVAVTESADGDVRPDLVDAPTLSRRQRELTGARWVMLDEVHGVGLVDVDMLAAVDWPVAGTGDVIVAERSNEIIAVWVGDCAPVALFGSNGRTRVVAHGGWRGLADGVLDVAVDAVEATGTDVAVAVLGPCIHPCCYEFGADELARVARGVGAALADVTALTAWGSPALDVPAAVSSALGRRGIEVETSAICTGCDERFRSHRRRAELERHALLAWFEGP
jgi:copper oxidase (laccase) domain-containing protein